MLRGARIGAVQKLTQGCGHAFGLAVMAQKFGNRAGIRHQIDQCHSVQFDKPLRQKARQGGHVIGNDHGRIIGGQFKRHRARRGQRNICGRKGRALGGAVVQNLGVQRPFCDLRTHEIRLRAHCGHHHAGSLRQRKCQCLPKTRGKARDFPRREPGRASTSAPSWPARNCATSAAVARCSATTGWPTKSQLMPAACIRGGSNGNSASTWSTSGAMRAARFGRHAQTEGAT